MTVLYLYDLKYIYIYFTTYNSAGSGKVTTSNKTQHSVWISIIFAIKMVIRFELAPSKVRVEESSLKATTLTRLIFRWEMHSVKATKFHSTNILLGWILYQIFGLVSFLFSLSIVHDLPDINALWHHLAYSSSIKCCCESLPWIGDPVSAEMSVSNCV